LLSAGVAACGCNLNCPKSVLSDTTNIRITNTAVSLSLSVSLGRAYLNSEMFSKLEMFHDNPEFHGIFLIYRKQTVLLLIQKASGLN
jgi:hypothetical protein